MLDVCLLDQVNEVEEHPPKSYVLFWDMNGEFRINLDLKELSVQQVGRLVYTMLHHINQLMVISFKRTKDVDHYALAFQAATMIDAINKLPGFLPEEATN